MVTVYTGRIDSIRDWMLRQIEKLKMWHVACSNVVKRQARRFDGNAKDAHAVLKIQRFPARIRWNLKPEPEKGPRSVLERDMHETNMRRVD
jgi:hypothetical protein